MKTTRRPQTGFSLIEILVVLVIIGLLIGIVAPNVIDEVDEAQRDKVAADFRNIETALKLYRLDNFTYPTSEQGLVALSEQPTLDPVPRNWRAYLDEEPTDPWGRPYLYLSPGENGEFDIYTLGADGISGGEGPNKDIGNWKTDDDS
ncbi:type II secretion system protein GspG [Exilibacterium tricleocarpae]|uniref:Type II secretion system core protein G n=1 Tax=Exilibacterium tricleocarpae TaxID=2591008 RepID=A0A545TZ99_9GAMM|nr:type II secretion system major pseudopilin GspG [Exilibacterium tricleocarpae]TQV82513.1 type II secretion system protein GspG [Exilibacterium tricleocarpae]